jgi:hypothetical protein
LWIQPNHDKSRFLTQLSYFCLSPSQG